jgi:hypothetical protein
MSSCPRCHHRIGLKTIMLGSGLAGTICPHCQAELRTRYWGSVALMLISLSVGELVGNAVRQSGAAFPAGPLALLGAFFAAYLGLAPVLLRFREKQKPASLLGR